MTKKLLFTLLAAAMALTASAEVANVKTTVSVLEGGREQNDAPRKVYSMESIILSENFDTLEEGTTEEPDYGAPLAIGTTDIDPVLTHGKQWRGDLVYPAGGAIALQSASALGMASLNTPLGDYSGSIKVSFLVKFLLCEWNDNGTMMHYPISNINVGLYNERENRFNVDSGEENFYGANLAAINIDDNGEWYRVVIEFDNYSAYNDAFLVFFTNTAVVLDDIEITRSSHKFIAAPVIAGLSDLTETSFTVNFEKVEAAFDYIAHLYVVDSYDSETGEPIYSPILDAGTMAFLEEYGMTVEEYMEMLGPDAELYLFYDMLDQGKGLSFTFSDLDPQKDYYYAIVTQRQLLFSEKTIHPANYVAAPTPDTATGIDKNSFTANWQPVAKADSYETTLYGVNKVVEDNDRYIIFDEEFSKTSNWTDSDNILSPEVISSEMGIILNDLTDNPGWVADLDHLWLVEDMIGLDGYGTWLTTPSLYIAGSDEIILSLKAVSPLDGIVVYIKIGDTVYNVSASDNEIEGEFILPTSGLEEAAISFTGADYTPIYFDYIIMSQNLKKGDMTYTYIKEVETSETSVKFSDLDENAYDMYAYSVVSVKGEGAASIKSEGSPRMLIDLKNGSSMSGVTAIDVVNENGEVTEVERYTIDGKRIEAPVKGLNIVRMSDGSVRKVMVR